MISSLSIATSGAVPVTRPASKPTAAPSQTKDASPEDAFESSGTDSLTASKSGPNAQALLGSAGVAELVIALGPPIINLVIKFLDIFFPNRDKKTSEQEPQAGMHEGYLLAR